jgi:hypothetical protein
MSTEPQQTAEEITLATLRGWAERTILITAEADPRSASGGFRRAARDVLAILNMNGAPPGEPVTLGNYPEERW